MGPFGMPELMMFLVMLVGFGVSLAWYVGVIVLLLKIWKKVKHLPG